MIDNMNTAKQAGVINTPTILMRSGVGPRKHLKEVGIAPRVDLPVGENLQDHITTGFDLVEALGLRLVELIGFIATTKGIPKENSIRPDLQLMIMPLEL
ncbi:unnamed protein product [Callosobruchus maculatus]|uniref:Glucose-methanol-choline oxidoreductase N-terminal domain-containing protein n=2 Tax=Callosobruchus maculatus TaxID=64391 RepID=A0A653CRL2_CALMS|nr:unnamed protein product [Callosobruchus maculatus]